MLVRPIKMDDLEALYLLASTAGVGMNSLPSDKHYLEEKIARSEASFQQRIPTKEASYLFALCDDQDTAQGVCGIEAYLGWDEPWYTYRVTQIVHACKEIDVYSNTPTLFLTNDQIGYSELCSLLIAPEARGNKNGPLLSRSRLLFIHQFRHLFGQKIFAEMRGFNDQEGQSPFWNALGKRFFNLEFDRIDFLTGRGQRSIIAELMPKYPVYSHLLPESARQCIGKVHPNTEPALQMLKQEGFRFENYIAIFDGGPVMEAYIDDLRLIQQSKSYKVTPLKTNSLKHPSSKEGGENTSNNLLPPVILCNESLTDFRCTLSFDYQLHDNQIELTDACLSRLNLTYNSAVTAAFLYSKNTIKHPTSYSSDVK